MNILDYNVLGTIPLQSKTFLTTDFHIFCRKLPLLTVPSQQSINVLIRTLPSAASWKLFRSNKENLPSLSWLSMRGWSRREDAWIAADWQPMCHRCEDREHEEHILALIVSGLEQTVDNLNLDLA